MSTALVATLRESIGYLRDDGYHQTARLMAVAADEIERLNLRVRALESQSAPAPLLRRDRLGGSPPEARAAGDPRHHRR